MSSFQGGERGIQNQIDFWLKINIPKGNYWILRIGVVGRCQKVPKLVFQNHWNLSAFFSSLKNTNFGAHFLLLSFFDKISFQITSFPKMMSDFWQLGTNPILKTQFSKVIDYKYYKHRKAAVQLSHGMKNGQVSFRCIFRPYCN